MEYLNRGENIGNLHMSSDHHLWMIRGLTIGSFVASKHFAKIELVHHVVDEVR